VKDLTRSIVKHAHALARENNVKAVLLYVDALESDEDLDALVSEVDFRVLLVTKRPNVACPLTHDACSVVALPNVALTRMGRIKLALMVGFAEGLCRQGDRVLCLSGPDGSGVLDTMLVTEVGRELELFVSVREGLLGPDVTPAVFERTLSLACQLAEEGREGKSIGTLFVLGDSQPVLAQSRQMVINPFKGYDERDRNVLDERLTGTIKEFASIDGAFLIRGDGVVLAAGAYLVPTTRAEPLPHGLGTRHEAAAAITASTGALALVVSESTGTVTIFREGRIVMEIERQHVGHS